MDNMTIKQRKKYICDNVNNLSIEDKKQIYMLIKTSGKDIKISVNKDGLAVNLDSEAVDESLIISIYTLVDHKIKRLNKTA